MTCSHCGNAAHLDLADGREHCNPCHRVPAFCRCIRSTAQRQPLWLELAKERRAGLSKDLTAA